MVFLLNSCNVCCLCPSQCLPCSLYPQPPLVRGFLLASVAVFILFCVYLVAFLEGQGPGTQTLVSSHLLASTLRYIKLEENSASLKPKETSASQMKRLEQAWLADLPRCAADSGLRA